MALNLNSSAVRRAGEGTVMVILIAVSVCHMFNDVIQSLIIAIYPMLKENFQLNFGQIGFITFTFQGTASVLQPVVGYVTDRYPTRYSLVVGMGASMLGLLLMASAKTYAVVLCAAALIGMGSSVFHPESSRVARLASGGRHGLAQSVFQVGGNFGTSIGPLLAAFVILPNGQGSVAWFAIMALIGIALLSGVGVWYGNTLKLKRLSTADEKKAVEQCIRPSIVRPLVILLTLTFSKYMYLASITSFFIFYLIHTFGVSVQTAQLHLFLFLGSVAAGTVIGGPIGDRIGSKRVIWWSILGVLPFTLALPYANLLWTAVLTVPIGLILASAFPAIVVYAQSLMPGQVGMVAGLFFGFAFGIAGIAAALLGWLADETSITLVYHICAFLPAAGLLGVFLPEMGAAVPKQQRASA